jgi:porin
MLGLSVHAFTGTFVSKTKPNKQSQSMKTKPLLSLIFFGMVLLSNARTLKAQENTNAIDASITQDVASNLAGGIQTGQAQLGLINLDFSLTSESMELWNNGTLRIHIQNTYGQKPTEKLVGDAQVFSNIENGNSTYLYQFWYSHRFGRLTLLAGKHDLNETFFTSELAGEYINSSFGIMPVASLNVPVSIFPATTLGLVGQYDFSDQLAMVAGVYNGLPGEITGSNFGTDLNLSGHHGYMYIAEIHLRHLSRIMNGTYKLGAFYHSGQFEKLARPSEREKGATGLYLLADQVVYREAPGSPQGLGTFLQLGYAPDKTSLNDKYAAVGLNYTGLIPGRPYDQAGVALAHASLNNVLLAAESLTYATCETVIEFTYKHQLTENLALQPDIQYIIHPGMKTNLNNAWTGLFRIQWTY